ncbi:glucose and ribitol dehydrogenase [Pyricularia oryzae 70-15]|uniref:Glucose and ribitol dehydrogenase n=3 Tax=Pyricularia oryzae TaxID=318829 RepID=G4N8T4_PYRO7|nr:glucose and ribitol dehydrogenase [Pyricularia oryzae 70-15]EHA51080.1 glucose and ribitol dehydrogenase [Pyricularia oryzae 70-15]KAI7914564.1 glucose and ribitol dehydrogenase [Pyricularia oryzae]KAI7917301.1 glucose and ribitol dehydrogenase [Pyricularia oryzae]
MQRFSIARIPNLFTPIRRTLITPSLATPYIHDPIHITARKISTTQPTRKMSAQGGKDGQFQPVKDAQQQNLPGLEKDMKPTSEATKLEGKDQFHEYRAANKLEGAKAFITGGDSGIGRSTAILFAREGADVTIAFLPEEQEDADETKKLVEKEGRQCLLFPGDLRNNETCQKAVQAHVDKFKKIDVLVNNASKQIMCKNLEDINLDDVQSTFQSNIVAMFAITKFALPHMEKGGSIINTTSTVAFRGTASMVDYAATKGAIVSFTRSLAQQLMPKGIRVNAVAPGPVHTPLQPASRPAEQMEGFGQQSGLGRVGQPSEIAPSFVFLASKDATLYHGQVLHAYPLGD